MRQLDPKNTAFSILLALVVIAILYRITPPSVDPVITLVISKNRTDIHNIHQVRNIEFSREVMVDELNLSNENRFRHPKLGNIGYADRFFVDINKEFNVKSSGKYLFRIGSDDGFSAKINGKLLCEFVGDRPFSMQNCPVSLPAGTHSFELSYFQGFGNSGLSVEYKKAGGDKLRFFGDNSKYIRFD